MAGDGVWALAAAAILTAAFVWGKRVRALTSRFQRRWLSAAAGVSVAYVFVDVLPELAVRRARMVHALGGELFAAEKRLYVLALAGFLIYHALGRFVARSHAARREEETTQRPDGAFWLHVGGFILYCLLIGYLLNDRASLGVWPLVAYAAAMLLHMAVIDSELDREHGAAYDRMGHWLLAFSLPAGCLMGLAELLPVVTLSRVFAFVMGGVVVTSTAAETPDNRGNRFEWFVIGAAAYAALLLLI